jgi:hypothetical protein
MVTVLNRDLVVVEPLGPRSGEEHDVEVSLTRPGLSARALLDSRLDTAL